MYAIEDIKQGEELTIYYNEPEEFFTERQHNLRTKWRIPCNCGWCKNDAQNPHQEQIEKLLKEYLQIR